MSKKKPCKICKTLTNMVVNIQFKAVHICDHCTLSIFHQQAMFMTDSELKRIGKRKK